MGKYIVSRWYIQAVALCWVLLSSSSWAAGLSGVIKNPQGEALEGVMVTLMDESQMRLRTRFTDTSGRYHFDELFEGDTALRLRLMGYADQILPLAEGSGSVNAVLQMATEGELLQQLPASAWAERVGLGDDRIRREFRVQCMMCHQQGYPNARWPQTHEDWYSVFDRMAHKRALLTDETRETVAGALIDAYNIEKHGLPDIPPAPTGKETQVEITEWRIENMQSSMHDVAVGPDGHIYGVDTVGDDIWRLNPDSHLIERLTHLKPNNRGEDAHMLLHTVIQAPDGAMWFTYAAGNLIARLDVETEAMKIYEMDYMDGIYPHTMRFDQDGQLWFTVSITNQLGTIDPATDEVVLYNIPSRNLLQSVASWPPMMAALLWIQQEFNVVKSIYDELMPIAYGIDVTPDGKVWFGQFNNRRIGSFDKKTETFEMVDTPFGGPRRFRADSSGNLWIPAFTDGLIYRYNPSSQIFTPFEMPTGRGDSTYALAVDPNDDTVWACGSNSDTMMHLDPDTAKVVTYRMPTRVTFCREISFGEDGSVWTSYSNYPSVSIEGGRSVFVRIKPLQDQEVVSVDLYQ